MSLLLVNSPCLRGEPGRSFFDDQKRNLAPSQYWSMPMEHLGLMSILSYCRSRGLPIASVNGMVADHRSLPETFKVMRDEAQRSGPPALIGFTNIDTLPEVVWLAERSRDEWPEARVVLGNVFASLNHDRLLSTYDCFDYAVVGDGEVAFAELAEAVLAGRPVDGVPSLVWRDGGRLRSTPHVDVDLDTLPDPARDELPAVLRHGFAGAVSSTRGCPYRCTFCGTGTVSALSPGTGYRLRSIEAVVDEIERLVKDFGIEFVSISDDLFISKHPRMQQRASDFADEVLRRRLDIAFMFDARVDAIGDLKLFGRLRRAGLRRVFIGIETGSAKQLASYRKQVGKATDPADALTALEEIGVDVVPGTIMFHAEVQPEELRETARLLRQLRYRTPRKFMDRVTVYAGTPLYREYAAKGYLTTDWPIGRWEFVELAARALFDSVVERIGGDPGISFEEAEAFFLAEVDAWEARRNVPESALAVSSVPIDLAPERGATRESRA